MSRLHSSPRDCLINAQSVFRESWSTTFTNAPNDDDSQCIFENKSYANGSKISRKNWERSTNIYSQLKLTVTSFMNDFACVKLVYVKRLCKQLRMPILRSNIYFFPLKIILFRFTKLNFAIGFYTTLCQSLLHLCLTSLSFLSASQNTSFSSFCFWPKAIYFWPACFCRHCSSNYGTLFYIPYSLFHISVQNNPLLLISRFDPFLF